MSATVVAILAILPLLLAAAAVFSAAETAIFSLTYSDRVRLRKQHPKLARVVSQLLARPQDVLVTLLFFNMMATTLYFVLTSLLLLEASETGNRLLGLAVSAINLLLMTVVAEVVSKMLAARQRVEFVRLLAPLVLWMMGALGPVRSFVVRSVVAPLTRVFVPPEGEDDSMRSMTPEELAAVLHVGEQEGAIDSDEQRVLRQVIHLGSQRVRDVMTPRTDMEWLDEKAAPDQVIDLTRRKRLTRLPIARAGGGGLDEQVIGILDVKRYLAAFARTHTPPKLGAFLDPPRYVPERVSLDGLLEQLRRWGAKVALCVDEHGAIVGVVSARDVVKQIAAELRGDFGAGGEAQQVEQGGERNWLAPGRFPARDLMEMFGLPRDPRVSTVAGLVLSLLGRLPQVGDAVRVGNLRLKVEAVTGRVVDRVRVEIVPESAESGPDPGAARSRRGQGRVRA